MTNLVLTARVSIGLFTNTIELPDPNGIEMVKTVTVTERDIINYTVGGEPRVSVKEFTVSQTTKYTPITIRPTDPVPLPKPVRKP